MSARPQPAARAAFERRMLTRPDTHDTVGTPPLERFRCLDIGGGLILSRAACASRFVATTRDGCSAAVGSQLLAMGPCRGCPVGAAHAAEQRAGTLLSITSGQDRGTVAKPGRVGSLKAGSYATRPAPVVEAPAAVVPPKRPSVAPAPPKPPVPSSAGAHPVVTPADGTDRAEPERAPVGPVEIADPPLSPPAVPVVSTGQRPLPTIVCARCTEPAERTSPNQRYCAPCREVLAQERASARRLKSERATATYTHGDVTDSARGWARRLNITPKAFRLRVRSDLPREQLFLSGHRPRGGEQHGDARKLTHPTTKETRTIREWATKLDVTTQTLRWRLAHGWELGDALSGPRPVGVAVERSTPQAAPERSTTSVGAVEPPQASDGRVATSTPVPHLDALTAELLELAMGVVQARAVLDEAAARHDEAAARHDEAAARHDEAAARHDRLVREYRARVAAVVNGTNAKGVADAAE